MNQRGNITFEEPQLLGIWENLEDFSDLLRIL